MVRPERPRCTLAPSRGRGERAVFEGETEFEQLGVSLYVLAPGEPIGMYHWEADEEDFLVLAGEALLIVEGEERPLRRLDFVHCPPWNETRRRSRRRELRRPRSRRARAPGGRGLGRVQVDETALRHGAGVEHETNDADDAYARFPGPEWTRYREGWLPG